MRFNVFLCSMILSVSASAAQLPEIPALKAWRTAADARKAKKLTPVLKENSIEFGSKILQLKPDGKIVCMSTVSGDIFNGSTYFYVKENGAAKYEWQRDHLDREKSRFYRSGRKYVWEIWYKHRETGAFPGLYQTLEVLPDDRIAFSYCYNLPANREGLSFHPWSFVFTLPENHWFGSTVNFGGKTVRLSTKTGKQLSASNQAEWIFCEKAPDRRFTLEMKRSELGIATFSYRPFLKQFSVGFSGLKQPPGDGYKFILDCRKGLDWKGQDVRGGVDFMAAEKLVLPDNSHRNLLENSSLERGFEGWHFLRMTNYDEHWDWQPFELDEQVVRDGKYSLKLNVRKDNVPNIGPIQVVADPGIYTVSFYARGRKGEYTKVGVRVPVFLASSHDWININNNTAVWSFRTTDKWTRYQATFEVKPEEPLLFLGFFASGEGTVWIDAVQLEKGKTATPYQHRPAEGRLMTSEPDNFIPAENKIEGGLRIISAKPEMSGQVRIRVKNFFEETLLDVTRDFRTGKNRMARVDLPLDMLPGLGVFVVRADYKLADGSTAYDFHRYAKIEFQTGPRRLKRMFGMDYENTARSCNFLRELERWRKLGVGAKHHVGHLRKDVWDMYKKYDVEPSNATMLAYKRGKSGSARIEHFFILDSDTLPFNVRDINDKRILVRDFYLDSDGTITPEYLARLKQAAKTVAAKYPHVKQWALGGEITCKMPNEWWGKGVTDRDMARMHALLLKAFAEGVREGNPEAKVYQDDPANMNPQRGTAETERLLEECNKLGVRFDLIAVHLYRLSPESPDLDADADKFLKMLDRVGYGQVPVLWPEGMLWGPFEIPQWGLKPGNWGKPATWKRGMISYDMGWTEKKTAGWYMRSWLVALKYSDRVLGATSGQTNNNCYMDVMMTPYAAQLVPNTLCAILGDSRFKKDIRFAPYVRTYVFEDEKRRPVAAVWCHKDEMQDGKMDSIIVETDFGDSLESVLDMMNSPRAFKPGKMRFPVSHFPLFFRGKPGTLKQMTAAFERTELISVKTISPLEISVNPADAGTLRYIFENRVSREFRGKFNGRDIRIPPAGQTAIDEPLKEPLKADSITAVKADGKLISEQGRASECHFGFEAFVVKRVPENVTVDTLDWSRIPAVPFPRSIGPEKKTSGFFRLGWNTSGLYLETVVRDEKFVHKDYPIPHDLWQNDCIQVYFDTQANARQRTFKGYDEDDYEYGVFPNGKGNAARVYRYLTVDRQLGLATQAPQDRTFAPDMPCRFSVRGGKLTYRVFFPAKYLLPIRLKKGTVFGFSILALNSDEPGKVNGALTLDADAKGCHNRPHSWPAAVLAE